MKKLLIILFLVMCCTNYVDATKPIQCEGIDSIFGIDIKNERYDLSEQLKSFFRSIPIWTQK